MALTATLVDSSGNDKRIYDCALQATDTGSFPIANVAVWTPDYALIQPQGANAGGVYDEKVAVDISGTTVTIQKSGGVVAATFKLIIGRNIADLS